MYSWSRKLGQAIAGGLVYPLSTKRVDENVAILEERHAAAAASASEQA
ncbi:hypothetical protein ACFU1Q_14645 [Brachybacterium paraconglomeratum]